MLSIGIFGIGLDTYWPQFPGLKERLLGYQAQITGRLTDEAVTVLDAGLIDTPPAAVEAAGRFNREEVDLVVLFITTYALSHTVLPLAQRINAPVLVLNLQPVAAIDYGAINAMGDRGKMTGEWLAHCQACVAPEICSVFRRVGIPVHLVTGYLDDPVAWAEIEEYVAAAGVRKALRNSRFGVVGHYYNGMLDVYSDMTQLAGAFGCHFELREFGEIKAAIEGAGEDAIRAKIDDFERAFAVSAECEPAEVRRAARTAVGLDRLVETNDLQGLAYYYEGAGDPDYENLITSVIPGFTLLTGRGVPVSGECEIKNLIAMKIMSSLGAGGSFSEFYAMDFTDEVVLLGHDGPAHFAMAEERVGLVPVPVYHGKPGKGLSIQMEVKKGAATLLSVCQGGDGKVYLLVAEGEAVAGPTLHIGNTNSRYRFPLPIREFMNDWSMAGPSHHCAIGVGHRGGAIRKLGDLLGLEVITIC